MEGSCHKHDRDQEFYYSLVCWRFDQLQRRRSCQKHKMGQFCKKNIVGTVTEHLLVWEGEGSSLPEWSSGVDVEDEEDVEEQISCNTRKDRFI